MKKLLVMAVLVTAACADDPEPVATDAETHEIVACGEGYDPGIMCEAACAEHPDAREPGGSMCTIDNPPVAGVASCDERGSVLWRGRAGCCIGDPLRNTITFYPATCE